MTVTLPRRNEKVAADVGCSTIRSNAFPTTPSGDDALHLMILLGRRWDAVLPRNDQRTSFTAASESVGFLASTTGQLRRMFDSSVGQNRHERARD